MIEIGSRTMDGQRTTEFEARLDPVRFLGKRTGSQRDASPAASQAQKVSSSAAHFT